MVTFFDPVQNIELSYHIDPNLIPKWDKVRKVLIKEDSDRIYLVDGRERTGKSVFAFQQAKYLDRDFNLSRVCFTPEEFLSALRKAKPGQCVVFDEAFRGLSSKASQSKVNKAIVQALMEVGQRNLIVFIVLPTFFLLEIYAAVLRSNCLFHVYKAKSGARKFRVYNYGQKSLLWNVGRKKGFSYKWPRVKTRGSFFNKWAINEVSYRKKKADSFGALDVTKPEGESDKLKELKKQIGVLYYVFKESNPLLSKREFFRIYSAGGGTQTFIMVRDSIRDYEKSMLEKGINLPNKYKRESILQSRVLNVKKKEKIVENSEELFDLDYIPLVN